MIRISVVQDEITTFFSQNASGTNMEEYQQK